jgi:general stress protein 26
VAEPTAAIPLLPADYGAPADTSGAERLPWSWAATQLEASRNYWICTTRADGRPHAMPVWGLWLDDAVWFSSGRTTQRVQNIARRPEIVIHLESGDEVVILEGGVEEISDRPALERFVEHYEQKYGYRFDPDAVESSPVFAFLPRSAYTWREADFPQSVARWLF